MLLVPLTEDFTHASLEKVRQRSAHWIGNSWASLGIFSHDSAKRPHGTHPCEQVGRSMWSATASVLNEQSLSLPSSSPFKSGREWLWSPHLTLGSFLFLIFSDNIHSPLPTQTENHFLQLISPSGQTPWSLSPMNPFPLNCQEMVESGKSQAGMKLKLNSLFSCVDISRLSALSHNGKGTVWMELTWAWKTRVRVKGHQSSWTRGSDRPCPSSPFPLPC